MILVGEATPGKCDECGFSVGPDGIDITLGQRRNTLCVLCRRALLDAIGHWDARAKRDVDEWMH